MTTLTRSSQERIDIRTTAEVKELINRAASTSGMSVSAFLVAAAQERAKQVLSESELMTLSRDDWSRFFEALEHPEKPRPNLLNALKQHKQWLEGQRD